MDDFVLMGKLTYSISESRECGKSMKKTAGRDVRREEKVLPKEGETEEEEYRKNTDSGRISDRSRMEKSAVPGRYLLLWAIFIQ